MSALSLLSSPSIPQNGYTGAGQSASQSAQRTQYVGASTAAGGGATAEAALAAGAPRAIPPPTPTRATPTASASRGDGRDTTAKAMDAKTDEAFMEAIRNGNDGGAEARRSVEAARDRLVAQEILARIPVPPEALPGLTADAERTTDDADPTLARSDLRQAV